MGKVPCKKTALRGSIKFIEFLTGQEFDKEYHFYNYNARLYDPVMGRFITPDSIVQDYYDPQSLNRYAYTRNNPIKYTDPSGHIFDTILDIGFIAYDLVQIVIDPSAENFAALGADAACAVLPFATGGGALVRAGKGVSKLADNAISAAAKSSDNLASAGSKVADNVVSASDDALKSTSRNTDFVVSSDGAVVHSAPDNVRKSLDDAGFTGQNITNPAGTETGTIHNVSEMKMDVRVMDGGPNHSSRVVTTRQGTRQPVNPTDGSNFGNIPKNEQRERSHIFFP